MRRKVLVVVSSLALCLVGAVLYRSVDERTNTPRGPAVSNGAGQPAPNLLLVTIDTLRFDRTGVGLTPAIDALAARGLRFTAARTTAPLTLPAHVSIMTGLVPPVHGVRENGTYRFDGSHATLARLLHAAGYRTAAFVAAYVLDRRFGLNDGFDIYDDRVPRDPDAVGRLEAECRGDIVTDRAIAWLRDSNGGPAGPLAPFFVWLHLYDPHAPYTPPAEFLQQARGQPYDGEVAFADRQVGRLLDVLAELRQIAGTTVVVVGDHGESLGDHGERTHGMLLFDAALRVPLVMAGPGVPHREDGRPVSLTEVAPTLVRLAGQAVPPGMPASDLTAATRPPAADVYSETEYPRAAGWSPVQSLVEDRWKLVQSSTTKLFDLGADPGEQHDVTREHESLARSLQARLAAVRASGAASLARRERPTADVAERLRALGYVAPAIDTAPVSEGPDPATEIAAWGEFEDALDGLKAREYPGAIRRLRQLVDAYPNAIVFRSNYARALQESGNVPEALAAARRAVAEHPADLLLMHALADVARSAGRLDEALRAEQAAAVLDPRDPAVQNGLGLLWIEGHRPADAARAFDQAVALDPTNAQYRTNLGNAWREAGDLARAEQAYRGALEIEPNAPDASNGLGVLLVQRGRPADAIAWFERALGAREGFYEAQLNLGIACQQAGDPERAAAAYRAVLAAPGRFARERAAARQLLAGLSSAGGR